MDERLRAIQARLDAGYPDHKAGPQVMRDVVYLLDLIEGQPKPVTEQPAAQMPDEQTTNYGWALWHLEQAWRPNVSGEWKDAHIASAQVRATLYTVDADSGHSDGGGTWSANQFGPATKSDPTTDDIREEFVAGAMVTGFAYSRDEARGDWDRWLAAHDAQVRAPTPYLVHIPHVPHGPKGVPEHEADAKYYRDAARNIRSQKARGNAFSGSNVTETVARLCEVVAEALDPDGE